MIRRSFTNATHNQLHKSNGYKLENMKIGPNNTHVPWCKNTQLYPERLDDEGQGR